MAKQMRFTNANEFNNEDTTALQFKLQLAIKTRAEIVITRLDSKEVKIAIFGSSLEGAAGSIKIILESAGIIFEADKSNDFILLSESQYQELVAIPRLIAMR